MTDEPKIVLTQSELDARFAEMRKQMLADIAAQFGQPAPAAGADVPGILDALAMRIAEVSDQGTQRKRVAPEELQAREKAFNRMGELLVQAQQMPKNEWPLYRLVGKTHLNDRVFDPFRRNSKNEMEPVRVRHIGIPNLVMRPLNPMAEAIFAEYVRSVGGTKEANNIAPPKPAWMTSRGTVIEGDGPSSWGEKGNRQVGDALVEDGDGMTLEVMDQNDPRAKEIAVIGTIADRAKVGQVESRAS